MIIKTQMKTNSILRSAKLRRKNVDNQRQIASEQLFYEPQQRSVATVHQIPRTFGLISAQSQKKNPMKTMKSWNNT